MIYAGGLPFLPILLAHEAGHFIACVRHGVPCGLPLFLPAPFGVGTLGAVMKTGPMTPRQMFAIAIAGPLCGLAVALPMVLVGIQAGWIGVAFNLFNLLPIWPLDGGRIMHSLRTTK